MTPREGRVGVSENWRISVSMTRKATSCSTGMFLCSRFSTFLFLFADAATAAPTPQPLSLESLLPRPINHLCRRYRCGSEFTVRLSPPSPLMTRLLKPFTVVDMALHIFPQTDTVLVKYQY